VIYFSIKAIYIYEKVEIKHIFIIIYTMPKNSVFYLTNSKN